MRFLDDIAALADVVLGVADGHDFVGGDAGEGGAVAGVLGCVLV